MQNCTVLVLDGTLMFAGFTFIKLSNMMSVVFKQRYVHFVWSLFLLIGHLTFGVVCGKVGSYGRINRGHHQGGFM